jgi:hypothetical protein
VSSGVSFMPFRLKIILIGKIKGKDHKICVILYYLCSRNIFIYRSVKKSTKPTHEKWGVRLQKSLKFSMNSSQHVNNFIGTNDLLTKQGHKCKIRNSPLSSFHSVNCSLLSCLWMR